MNLTHYHTKYFSHLLTKRYPPDSLEKFVGTLADAQVDLNPHQVDAALFAFQSPLSRGALLADEVGLGKTIEAGLVISQKWAERRRKILVITPSNLRKQWYLELTEKFFLPCRILESKFYNAAIKQGRSRPFEGTDIVICSYQFARAKAEDIAGHPWDLVVVDEAHRLRNVYKPSNVIANTLKTALSGKNKLLLTATPLQNNLLELYGLVSFIDEHAFGDFRIFREQLTDIAQEQVFQTLKARLKPVCHRTLRRQVLPYIKFTRRYPIVQPFMPEESEDRLYNLVSEYYQRENIYALPSSQRSLMTLVLRKLLASSSFAIAGALESLSKRLKARLGKGEYGETLEDEFGAEYEGFAETAEEWGTEDDAEPVSGADRDAIIREIEDLEEFELLATSIQHNAKGKALIQALKIAFEKAAGLGAEQKAIIFTESRRTQSYLLRVLADSPFSEGIVLFNGSNNDDRSKRIYADWFAKHEGTDRVTGSRTADMRSAIIEYFRDQGRILIATEAGAEGINLQFCSLVVNYDLPWNPQCVEQRIGRSHRYGQQHDVVVVNFLNRKNEADQRVFRILSEKFKLFEGVFGASDEVLGAIESGVDFEKRIVSIYQHCRKPEEIQAAFDQLQSELGTEINESMTRTRRQLMENFDDEVREKLRVRDEASKTFLGRFEKLLMRVTRHELGEHAEFIDDSSFRLKTCPFPEIMEGIPLGLYELPRRSGEAHLFRRSHVLAETVLDRAKRRDLRPAEVRFAYTKHAGKVSLLETLAGKSGWLTLRLFSVESLDQAEDHLIFSACTDDGEILDPVAAERMMTLQGDITGDEPGECDAISILETRIRENQDEIQLVISERNARAFEQEADKLETWADEVKLGLEREIKELDRRVKEARRTAKFGGSLEEKLAAQKQIKALEAHRNQKRKSLFDAQDEVDARRGKMIEEIEGKLAQSISSEELFRIRWVLE